MREKNPGEQQWIESIERARPRIRVTRDGEGWLQVRGSKGRFEHRGDARIYAYTDKRRLHAPVLAVPGVTTHQRGDYELVVALNPEDTAGIAKVAAILKPYSRRAAGSGNPEALRRWRNRATKLGGNDET